MSLAADLAMAYGYVLCTLAYGAFAVYLFSSRHSASSPQIARWALFGLVLVSAAWGMVGVTTRFISERGLLFAQVFLDLTRYSLCFILLLILGQPARKMGWSRVATPLGGASAVLVGCGLMSLGVFAEYAESSPYFERLALYSGLALPIFGLILIEQLIRNVAPELRWNVKPLCIGLGCIFVFDLYLHSQAIVVGQFATEAIGLRGAIHALAVPFLFVATSRQVDWAGKIQISRTAAFHSATLLLAGVYLLLISAVSYYVRYYGGTWGPVLQTGLLFVAVVMLTVLTFSGAFRAKVRVLVGKNFFRYQYDYRREWLAFTATLSSKNSPQEMGQLVIRALGNLVESGGGMLWFKAPHDQEYVQTARLNMQHSEEKESSDSSFCEFLAKTGWIVVIDDYRRQPEIYADLVVPNWLLGDQNVWLVIPLLVGDDLIGFVLLAKPKVTININWEVTDLLKTASRQAAAFLAQMYATEALLEARKFDAFNRMSAFVVHDLKNIVTQLSLMMKNAKRLQDNPEFREDMLMTVDNSLEKMRQLMVQLRDGDAPRGGLAGVDLAPLARNIESAAIRRGRKLDVGVVERVIARGHEQRIERVLGHLVQNALDATSPEGRVWLKIARSDGQAKVEVGDTGHGMSPDFVRDQLFKPFASTKNAGMGIGAYESLRYVRELGGSISVESEPDRGTTVTVLLPLFETKAQSDLHMSSAI